MSERYSKLFALSENLYTEGAPLVIAAGALLKDNQTGKILAQIKFKNISAKTIKAVKVAIHAFDVSGTELQEVSEHQFLDLSASRDSEFGQKNPVYLPDAVTRSFSCECKSVIFTDGTVWESNRTEAKQIIKAETLSKRLGALAAQYQRETIKNAQFVVTDDRDLWICACGAINRQDEETCHSCHSKKEKLLAALNKEILQEQNAVYSKAEADQKEKQAQADKAKKVKTTKIAVIAAVATVVIIAAIIVISQVIVPSGNYNSAVTLMNEGKYEEAIAVFEGLGDYKDSSAKINECTALIEEERAKAQNEKAYQEALSLLENGDFEEAMKAFLELGDYSDSAEMAKVTEQKKNQSLYEAAETLENDGNIGAAAIAFGKISDYADASDRSMKLWNNLCERSTYYISGQNITALTTDGKLIYENELIDVDTSNIISLVGADCGLSSNGTITKFLHYSWYYGFDISDWDNIVDVIIDDGWAIGLRNDGTLSFSSENYSVNLTNYTDIIQIVECDDYVIALGYDGSLHLIKIDGNIYDNSAFENWIEAFGTGSDIINIKSSDRFFLGIAKDGSTYTFNLHSEHAQKYDYTIQDFFTFEDNDKSVIGILKADGTVEALGIQNWADIKEVVVSKNCVIGIKKDGSIMTHGNCTCSLSEFTNIYSICPITSYIGKDNLIGIKNDGTVIISGENLTEKLRKVVNVKLP